MPRHKEKRILPYTAKQLYELVADIESYPSFLPWCVGAHIQQRDDHRVVAELWIGYKFFRERFTSVVIFSPPARIDVRYFEGPFKYLENHWIFKDLPEGGCEVDFHVDFEFKSIVFQKIVGILFTEAVHKMVMAFEKRANEIYSRA